MMRRSLAVQIATILIISFLLAATAFGYLYHQQERAGLHQLMLNQAQTLFQQIQISRHWNAGYGGVYVLKKAGDETNPYLYQVGPREGEKADIRPEIIDSEGRVYILKNPALMAREIAELTRQQSDISFHLTSLRPINPDNRADGFEKRALEMFELGKKEWSYVENGLENGHGSNKRFRYMAPLKVEKSCLQCHGFQGYREGDIRGGLSLDLPMDNAITVTKNSRFATIAGGFAVLIVLILILWLSLKRLIINPINELQALAGNIGSDDSDQDIDLSRRHDEIGSLSRTLVATDKEVSRQQQELMSLATKMDDERRHDPLTGLHNRRHLYLEGPKLFAMARRLQYDITAMMIDLDHFKQVNDTFGHAAGDQVLIAVANALLKHSRSYDVLIRFGGEEFALILLNCNYEQSLQIARRIREDIASLIVKSEDNPPICVTCSIGISTDKEMDMEQLIIIADEEVYKAKAAGRNRVRHAKYQP